MVQIGSVPRFFSVSQISGILGKLLYWGGFGRIFWFCFCFFFDRFFLCVCGFLGGLAYFFWFGLGFFLCCSKIEAFRMKKSSLSAKIQSHITRQSTVENLTFQNVCL